MSPFIQFKTVVVVFVLLAWANIADAQSFPRLKPLPPKKDANVNKATSALAPGSPWQLLTNQPPVLHYTLCGPRNPILLTDGTVMLADDGCQDWWKLTPDEFGSYVNGTWTQLASLPEDYSPLYHASAVLPDGRVIIEGGEYNFFGRVNSDQGAIYDPLANTWTPVAPPPFFGGTIGDAQSVVLFDGTFMLANALTRDTALLDANTLTWTPTGANKFDVHYEEGWTLLPNKKVLTVDTYSSDAYDPAGTNSEIYNPNSGKWSSAGSTIVRLWASPPECGGLGSNEVGPGVLRPDGTVFYTGANCCGTGHTAIYHSDSGLWTPGPDFPASLGIPDGPAALEPNGKVLMMASPFGSVPSTFLEWDGVSLTEISPAPHASLDTSFYGNMLVLPTGQILFADFYFVSVYNPTGTYNPAWAPRIQSAPARVSPGGSYVISGYRLNGMSQGAAYGDDQQSATNYPLVRIMNNATGHVFYSRTHHHSSMGVAVNGLVSTHFDVPATQELGASQLVVVANGIPSVPIAITVQ